MAWGLNLKNSSVLLLFIVNYGWRLKSSGLVEIMNKFEIEMVEIYVEIKQSGI